jgi:glucose-1-phosphate adenylyltransferase
MAPVRTVVVVLAGGAGGRLDLLTTDRAKPAVPYGGSYRLIDVPLSNALHSGLSDVWVVQQFHPVSLEDHLSNGRPWDLDRTTGGLLLLHPAQGTDKEGWHSGTADALWRQSDLLREFDPEAVVVVSADAVYRLDYEALVQEHRGSDAAVTMVTTEVDPDDAARYGVVQVDGDGRITGYAYKPEEPQGNLVTNEVFVFDTDVLVGLLDELADLAGFADGDDGLKDLGDGLLPRLVDQGRAREHRFDDYWRDLGTVESYWAAHMDLLADEPPFVPDDPSWPLRTHARHQGPARVADGARVDRSLVGAGAQVAGTAERSVLAAGAVVEAGAQVRDSVLLPGAVVCAGAVVERTILDDGVEIGADARVGGPGATTLVGRRSRVAPGSRIPAGGRYPGEG